MSVKYEILELDEGHYIKMLKCFSPTNSKESEQTKKDGLIVLFPGKNNNLMSANFSKFYQIFG